MENYEVKNWQEEVIDESYRVPVLVDFWAEWCAPCRMLGPVLEHLAQKANGAWKLVKVNTEVNREIAELFAIRSIPHCKLFFEGKAVNEFTGALPQERVAAWLQKSIPSPADKYCNQAEAFMLSGDNVAAAHLLDTALELDPANSAAKILLARALLLANGEKAAGLIAELGDYWGSRRELLDALRQLSGVLTAYSASAASSEVPEERAFLAAVQAFARGNAEAALENCIESVRINRKWAGEIANKTCIALFKYLGEEHPVTLRQRKAFGRALYV